jgi:hypothetical protein
MKNSAISILSTFSDNEIISFGEYLESPFHNKNRRAVQLFDLLKKYHPFYEDVKLTKVELFAGIFGKEQFKESYIRNLFSDLKILLENYLLHSRISKSPGRIKILIEELQSRKLGVLMNKKLDSFEKEIEKANLKDQEYYSNKLFVYEMKSFSTVDITLTDDFRKDQISAVIKFFLIDLMESSFQLAIEEQRVQIRYDFASLKYVLEYVKNNQSEFSNVPLLMIYYYLWMGILEDDSNANFSRAREYFKTHFNTLTQPDKKNIYSVMQIYYANKIQAGDTSYNRIMLDLLLEMLDYKVISHNRKDSINLNLYCNILILCFKLNEKAKLKKFVTEYLKFVRAESRNTVSAYSSAHINFRKGIMNLH